MAARILVADDSVTIQKVVELTFSKEDVVLIQARSGEEAIRKAREGRPDLVLLDLVMPDKSGYEVCTALRAEPTLSTIPIILLTGTFEAFDRDEGLRAGANDFVTKPFESQVLISKVKQLLFAKTVERSAPIQSGQLAGSESEDKTAPPPEMAPSELKPISDLFPPTEEISQDRLWQALESIPPPTQPEPLSLPVSSSTEVPALELPSSGAASVQAGPERREGQEPPAIPADDLEMATLPEALSLEELLASPPGELPVIKESEPLLVEALPDVPVFDLTADMEAPSLPLVEVGTGEPPTFSVEDLLLPKEGALPEAGASGFPWPDFEPASGTPLPETNLGEEFPGSAIQLDIEDSPEPGVGAPAVAPPEAHAAEEAPVPPVLSLTSETAVVPEVSAPLAATGDFEVAPLPAAGPATPDLSLVPTVPPHVETVPSAGVEAGPSPDLESMRQIVTTRVAHDLAQELSDKLLDRIDRVVREVVPDLAEILITREIERIRALAEGKPSA